MRKHSHNCNHSPFQDHKTTVYPLKDHTTAVPPLQNHKTVHSIKDLKNMFLDSFEWIGSMPGEYSITLDPNVLQYNTEGTESP